jgi:methyl-accepting chemotaxis protein
LEPELVGVELEEAVAPEPEPEEAEIGEKPPPGAEPPLVEVVQARVGWGRILFVGLLSAILGAILALAFLFVVNGTLDFHTATMRAVQSEGVRLEGELDALRAKLGDVEGRLQAIRALDSRLTEVEADTEQLADGLEELAGELEATQDQIASMTETMGALRQEFTNLSEDLDGMADHVSTLANRVDELEEQLANLSQEIEAVQQAADRFDAFLDGLRELLGSTEGMRPGTSPLGPSPLQTPTLRPMVTVIPLATPTPTPRP